jgi:hypothetical protein
MNGLIDKPDFAIIGMGRIGSGLMINCVRCGFNVAP